MQPPLTPVAPDEPLYEAFYGLREQPFALTTDPRFLFLGNAHRRAYEELLMGLRRREGVLLLTGDTGMGKTTLCRAVIDTLGPRTFSALILNPYMTDAEVLRVILRDFGLVSREEIRKGAFARADLPQLLDMLEGFLKSLVALNSYAVVIIDEAQSLSSKVLDQIRVLGGYELDGQRLLQIMLVGQPGLITAISSDALRALDERVSRRAVLGPLPPADVDAYIQHRLTIAGGRDTVEFRADAVNLIAELTRGVPRRINLLCDRTLEAGRVEGTTTITPAIVQRASQQADADVPPVKPVTLAAPPPVNVDELPLNLDDHLAHAPRDEYQPTVSFGHDDAQPRGRRWGVMIVLLLLLLSGLGLGTYAVWAYTNAELIVPVLPAAPARDLGAIGTPFAPPTALEEQHVMDELLRTNPAMRQGGG